jgi:hypothetical protein
LLPVSTGTQCSREPARPCRHCGGKHWDNDYTKKKAPKQVNAIEVDNLDDEYIEMLEDLTSNTISDTDSTGNQGRDGARRTPPLTLIILLATLRNEVRSYEQSFYR